MMSVKHINADGDETVSFATSVRFRPANAEEPARLWVFGPSDQTGVALTGGRAFVMNETGATVARYDLPPAGR